jgi:hypothetical protein
MVLPGIESEWNYWTDTCDPQEFMNLSRAQGHPTIGAAVDAYVVEIPGLDHAWGGAERRGVGGDPGCADVVSLPHARRGVDLASFSVSRWLAALAVHY